MRKVFVMKHFLLPKTSALPKSSEIVKIFTEKIRTEPG